MKTIARALKVSAADAEDWLQGKPLSVESISVALLERIEGVPNSPAAALVMVPIPERWRGARIVEYVLALNGVHGVSGGFAFGLVGDEAVVLTLPWVRPLAEPELLALQLAQGMRLMVKLILVPAATHASEALGVPHRLEQADKEQRDGALRRQPVSLESAGRSTTDYASFAKSTPHLKELESAMQQAYRAVNLRTDALLGGLTSHIVVDHTTDEYVAICELPSTDVLVRQRIAQFLQQSSLWLLLMGWIWAVSMDKGKGGYIIVVRGPDTGVESDTVALWMKQVDAVVRLLMSQTLEAKAESQHVKF